MSYSLGLQPTVVPVGRIGQLLDNLLDNILELHGRRTLQNIVRNSYRGRIDSLSTISRFK